MLVSGVGVGDGGLGYLFFTETVYLCYAKAVYQVLMFYHAWNWLKSLWWCGVVVVVWWLKPILVFSLAKAEQHKYMCYRFQVDSRLHIQLSFGGVGGLNNICINLRQSTKL